MASFASDRLQAALSFWKDTCWFVEASFRAAHDGVLPPNSTYFPPQIYRWKQLEGTIFNNTVLELKPEQWGTFLDFEGKIPEFDAMYRFPFEFFEWSRKSRRVFHLPEGLWKTLAAATYPAVRWQDVLFPFESFILTLEGANVTGMDVSGGQYYYDTILVSHPKIARGYSLRMLGCSEPNVNSFLTEETKHRFDVMCRRGQRQAIEFLDDKFTEWRDNWAFPPAEESVVFRGDATPRTERVRLEPEDLLESFGESDRQKILSDPYYTEGWLPAMSDAAKIVVGWCLYLRTLSSTEVLWKEKKRPKQKRGKRGVTGIITQPEHICTILGEARLDPSTYGVSERKSQNSGFFKRPHWRRRHMKRRNRTPVTAPKDIEVPPRLIRKDLVPYFGIIGGTKTEVLEDE